MLQALSLYKYVSVLICTDNAYHANSRWHRQEVALQTQEVAPTDSRGGPPPLDGVALCSMWHFVLRGWILEVAPTIGRCGT